jgi:hypothetical protein
MDVHHAQHDLRWSRYFRDGRWRLASEFLGPAPGRQELHAEHTGPHYLRRKWYVVPDTTGTYSADMRNHHLENYAIQNRVFSVLLGDAVPEELEGTTDDNYYNHYSEISTVEANWYVVEQSSERVTNFQQGFVHIRPLGCRRKRLCECCQAHRRQTSEMVHNTRPRTPIFQQLIRRYLQHSW